MSVLLFLPLCSKYVNNQHFEWHSHFCTLAFLFNLCYNCFMENLDLEYICTIIGNLSGIPIRLYKNDEQVYYHSLVNLPKDPFVLYKSDILNIHSNLGYYITPIFNYYGIRGGMDVEEALSLSDSYIQKCELLNSMASLTNLQYRMILDFTERVERIRHGKQTSKLVIDISNYIQHHLSEAITTEDIANFLFISRSRLSTKFKAETGINLTDFIMQEKIEEAKRLLRYSDKTSYAISSYLGFASQSHFSLVFKKHTGKTPNEYRELHSK